MTESVLDHKYGSDIKDAFNNTAAVAGNIYDIKRAPERLVWDQMHDLTHASYIPEDMNGFQQFQQGSKGYAGAKFGENWDMNEK